VSGQGVYSPTTLTTSTNQPKNMGGQVSYQPLTAYLSYGILDWHIMHEDHKVPARTSALNGATDPALNVRLNIGSIMRAGYSMDVDGTRYQGLSSALSATYPVLGSDIIVADLDDGNIYTIPAQSGQTSALSVDYRNGIVHFNSSNFYGHAVRIYYKAEGDWAVSAYRAFSNFQRFIPPIGTTAVTNLNYQQYYRGPNDPSQDSVRLYFPQSYAGMAVSLDYTYSVPEINGNPKCYTVYGEVHRISDSTESPDSFSGAFCYVDVPTSGLNALRQSEMPSGGRVTIMPDAQSGSTLWNPTDGVIQRVRGISLGARAVRKDVVAFRGGQWRISTLETCLSLSP